MSDFAGFYSKSKQLFLQSGYPSKMHGFLSAKRKKNAPNNAILKVSMKGVHNGRNQRCTKLLRT